MEKKKIGIYIHIPFCSSKCNYCNFYSIVSKDETMLSYVKAVVREIEIEGKALKNKVKVNTIYIGGGTPNCLPSGSLEKISRAVRKNFDCQIAEFTIEFNPNFDAISSLNEAKATGADRISIGVQSLCDEALAAVGRRHTAQGALNFVKAFIDAGFLLNVDLIVGLPKTNIEDIENFISTFTRLKVEHISAYCLSVEEGTPLEKEVKCGEIVLPSEDETADMYDFAISRLERAGFLRYEVSNFAKEGRESKHNCSYWNGSDYLAIGAGAVGLIDNERYEICKNVEAYIAKLGVGVIPKQTLEVLTLDERIKERIILALRTTKGLDILKFNAEFDLDFLKTFSVQIEKTKNYTQITNSFYSVKSENFNILNTVLLEFI